MESMAEAHRATTLRSTKGFMKATDGLRKHDKENRRSAGCPPHGWIAGECIYCGKKKRLMKSATQPKFPRDDQGRSVPRACPVCDCGVLQYEGDGFWRCDGLADPDDTNKELQACTFTHEDGKPYQHSTLRFAAHP